MASSPSPLPVASRCCLHHLDASLRLAGLSPARATAITAICCLTRDFGPNHISHLMPFQPPSPSIVVLWLGLDSGISMAITASLYECHSGPSLDRSLGQPLQYDERVRTCRRAVPAAGRSYRCRRLAAKWLRAPCSPLCSSDSRVAPNSTIYNCIYHDSTMWSTHRKVDMQSTQSAIYLTINNPGGKRAAVGTLYAIKRS
ncbi:uncharacterized protein K460DRAFT_356266 [Cucurbitaria berberidis CBS 394.84]|uniref:Uncharacterized protein n=1 Tax=Cucurbitaria berberidis CBS 394.84 TaxID=1168544 RepID=A0A9P4GI61_9PLEO|nr:uncharacterized protein K460DRAFT_356266 [Cucurbitaria berberidis CBS 394.84]KAF1846613.1 hypothetical protein K460DRAFT_356266 [Cucurbitaria berberidis CBS 394.84]